MERFDRTPNGKLHVVSMAGLIGADYRLPSIDYIHIFQVCAMLTHSVAELCRDGDWHFAPAYDLLPSDGINGFRTTSINDKIEPTKEDLLTVAAKAGLNEQEADVIFDRVDTIVRRKEDVVANCMK